MNNVALIAEGEKLRLMNSHSYARESVNRLLAGRQAAVDFKKPWDFVLEFKDSLDFERAGLHTTNPAFGGICTEKIFSLPLLDKLRTFFKEGQVCKQNSRIAPFGRGFGI